MAGKCHFCCVLIQALLNTVYGQSTEVKVNCSNQNGIVGKPLHLTCTVTCDECISTSYYKWSKLNNDDIKCFNKSYPYRLIDKRYRYHCTIPSASEKHNGTFRFWVQMKSGTHETTLNITIAKKESTSSTEETFSNPPAKATAAIVPVIFVFLIITVTIVVCAYRKRRKELQYIATCDVETGRYDENEH